MFTIVPSRTTINWQAKITASTTAGRRRIRPPARDAAWRKVSVLT